VIGEAIRHRGFAFVDVLQVCASYFDATDVYDRFVYVLDGHDASDFDAAWRKAREWDYNSESPIAIGTFYRAVRPTLEERLGVPWGRERDTEGVIAKVLEARR